MRFVFSRRFFVLFALGFLPLTISWKFGLAKPVVVIFDFALIFAAIGDYFASRATVSNLRLRRELSGRFAIGGETTVTLRPTNVGNRRMHFELKDEFPPEMKLSGSRQAEFMLEPGTEGGFSYTLTPSKRGGYEFGHTAVRFLSRLGLVWCQADIGGVQRVKVYPNMARAREIELKALGARSFLAMQRRAVRRGEGREFESMRDYVRGDEMRHISWTATARRSRLTTRQYQIERDQTVIIAIDAGRLMTGRIGDETKFDTAIHAALALISACTRAGDNCGLVVFGRRVNKFIAQGRGPDHLNRILESLYDLEPELIEPSYARAFQFIASSSKKRAFIVILTDLVDKESSRELISSLKLFRGRHLPLVVTIGDRDLSAAVSSPPENLREVFRQSAAEEIIFQRESALRAVETLGGLALDVTTRTLGQRLLETYLRVKDRGLL